jgi:hypothetical protein
MKKTLLIIASILSLSFASVPFLSLSSYATSSINQVATSAKQQVQQGINDAGGTANTTSAQTLIGNIVNTMLFLVGVLSVIMIIYGGIQYVISVGDSGKVAKAKNTIIYAVVGLIVAILSYAIVNFVISQL